MNKKDYFKYNNIQIPDCSFRISPSSIEKFFTYPSIWYKENILNQKQFVASTSTVLGTICHASAESYCNGTPITREDVEEYITKTMRSQPIDAEPINPTIIRDSYSSMAMTLINDYVRKNMPTEVEMSMYSRIIDDIYVGGTCDAISHNLGHDGIIIDYKTYNSSTKPSKIPWGYKIQCLAYAFMAKDKDIHVERIRLVYVNRPIDTRAISEKTGKPIGKLTPPEVTVLTETITPEDWEMVENTLKLIALTVKRAKEDPTLVPLLFKSMKL